MAENKIKVAVISCGNRSRKVVTNLLRDSNRQVEIAAIYDPDPAEMKFVKETWETPETRECATADEAINTPGVTWVMVFSPNSTHGQYICQAFEAGKNVFTEKPLATTIGECQKIYEAHQKSGLLFATGFVLRYAPIYRKVKELLDSGEFGKILSIDANENVRPYHGGYIMCNWRRKTELAGSHILEKCCHDLDLINWFVGSHVSKAAAFGGRNFFKPENDHLRLKHPVETFKLWRDPHAIETPFNDDNDLMDNLVAIMEYRNEVRVQFQCTMSNALPERRMYFSCTEGNIVLDLYAKTLSWQKLGSGERYTINFPADGHGGGDAYIMKELYDSMVNGTLPKCGGNEGLESAVTAIGIDTAALEKRIFDYEPVWKSLGR